MVDNRQRDITPEEGEKLRDLIDHPGWEIYRARLLHAEALALAQAAMPGETEFSKGFYSGLRRARELPKWMLLEVTGQRTNYPDESPSLEHVLVEPEEA